VNAPRPRGRPPDSPARRTFKRMLVMAFGLHAVAIAIHQLARVDTWPERWRMTFLGVWLALTVAVIGPALRRIRQARGAARRPPRP
jgi:hypothetical protein